MNSPYVKSIGANRVKTMQAFKNNLTSEAFWLRLVFMLLSLLLVEIAASILTLLVAGQFLYRLFNESSHHTILQFSNSLGRFILHSYRFLSYQTESKPFPFSDWPEPEDLPQSED
ncbi:MAG: hypothetical protein ACI9S7_000678 [Candidatus Paceibacteria bacterium]|jgi:hypothetical protein|tara:strand:+ start:1273 stop:1617 length:345 start_codon:yes stop_codon:yes gene_type:complete